MSKAIPISQRFADLKSFANNPYAAVRNTLESAEDILEGRIEFVDASNPFALAIEATCVNTAYFLSESEAVLRRQYPSLAQTPEELYTHLSDTDLAGAFSMPSRARFSMVMQLSEIHDHMVPDADGLVSRITIPRNTVFTVADLKFSLQYPIHILKYRHGGIQVVFDTQIKSPLKDLVTNSLDMEIVKDPNDVEYLKFDFEADQFDIVSASNTIDGVSGFTTKVDFVDQFYYCRVYYQVNGVWTEMKTTYSEEVYDASTPTANIRINGQQVTCTIPFVYVNNSLVRGRIRVDVYQTKGDLNVYLSGYSPADFSAKWNFLDEKEGTRAVAALSKITNKMFWSTSKTTGGRNLLSFEDLRKRVMDYTIGPRMVPTTRQQNQAALEDEGYKIVPNIDTVTQRSQWATKPLPRPDAGPSETAATASMMPIACSLTEAFQGYGVKRHSTGATLTNQCLFVTEDNVNSLISSSRYLQLSALNLDELAQTLNQGKYSFTPFYYVLDNTGTDFAVRPYSLDDPKILSRSFEYTNPTTGLSVVIGSSYSIEKTPTGYRLTVQTLSNDAYREMADSDVFCQLSVLSDSTGQGSYQLGTIQARTDDAQERVFIFDLSTDYDIDSEHGIVFTSMVSDSLGTKTRVKLTDTLRLVFGTSAVMPSGYASSFYENVLGQFQLSPGSLVVGIDLLKIEFGKHLGNLWTSYRSIAAEVPYLQHTLDVPMVYEEDVYETDADGSFFDVVGGQLVYSKLHSKGDPVLNADGTPRYLHRVGDPVIDEITGLPKPKLENGPELKRVFDVLVLDAIYSFANDTNGKAYLTKVKDSLNTWITDDLKDINSLGLEQTKTYFHPKVSRGLVTVRINEDQLFTIDAEQTLGLTLYVPQDVFANSVLTASIYNSTIRAVEDYLQNNTTISDTGLRNALMKVYGSDVVGITIDNLLGRNESVVATMVDSSNQFSLAKNLRVQANGQLVVVEAIIISFAVHKTETLISP
jgi:hypothetical protein